MDGNEEDLNDLYYILWFLKTCSANSFSEYIVVVFYVWYKTCETYLQVISLLSTNSIENKDK